jgi:hypothetical protein
MITLKRNKRQLYLCKKYIEGNLTKYSEPESIYTDYQPISSTGEIISIGQEYTQYLKIEDTIEIGNKFSNGDRCYVYVDKPEEHDEFCMNADFYVSGNPIITLNSATITLKRLTGDEAQ